MRRCLAAAALPLALLAAGCLPQQLLDTSWLGPPTETVPASPFGVPPLQPPPGAVVNYAPAPPEMCMRVDAIGRKLTQANPGSGVRPGFAIHGSPKVEVFHQGTTMVHITQPLVQKCKSEAELAAVIALELGKMVSEREALAHPRTRSPERTVPADVPIGNSGQVAALDQVRLAELARFEQEKKAAGKPLPPPDPHKLAAIYLEKAGYSKTSLDAVRPLLDEAEANYILEKQFKNAGLLGHVPPRTP